MNDNELREALAEYAHHTWSGWMRWMFDQCSPQDDGTTVVPTGLVAQWVRQMNTPYDDLPEHQKESDRKEADTILAYVGKRNQS